MATVAQKSKNVETLAEAHQNFNRRDFDALAQKVAEDITYHDQAGGRTFSGREEFITEWLQGWVSGFSDARIEEPTYIDGGDAVVALITGRGMNDGSFGPFPATGERAEFRACEVIRFNEAGKIVSGELFYDQMTILAQLGHIEEPAKA